MPPMTAHQPDRIVTCYDLNNYFDILNSSTSIEFLQPIRSPTKALGYLLLLILQLLHSKTHHKLHRQFYCRCWWCCWCWSILSISSSSSSPKRGRVPSDLYSSSFNSLLWFKKQFCMVVCVCNWDISKRWLFAILGDTNTHCTCRPCLVVCLLELKGSMIAT